MSCGQSGGTYNITVQWNTDNTGGAVIENYYVRLPGSIGPFSEFVMARNPFTVTGLSCSADQAVIVIAENCAGNSTEATTMIRNPGE